MRHNFEHSLWNREEKCQDEYSEKEK